MDLITPESLLSDAQWEVIEPMLPQARRFERGRKPRSNRAVVTGILWVLRTGNRWQDLPPTHPSPSTCQRRLRQWIRSGLWTRLWQSYVSLLSPAARADWGDAFGDGSFLPDKKIDLDEARTNAARARDEWRQLSVKLFWSKLWKYQPLDLKQAMTELALIVQDNLRRRAENNNNSDDGSDNNAQPATPGLAKARPRAAKRFSRPLALQSETPDIRKATPRLSAFSNILDQWRTRPATQG